MAHYQIAVVVRQPSPRFVQPQAGERPGEIGAERSSVLTSRTKGTGVCAEAHI